MSQRSRHPTLARIVTALAAVIALAVDGRRFPPRISCRHTRRDMPKSPPRASLPPRRSRSSPAATPSSGCSRMPASAVCSPCLVRRSEAERRIVISATGEVVAEQGGDLPQPVMAAVSPVYDSGVVIGRVEIQRSHAALLLITAVVATLAGSLRAVAFAVLRSMPLRLLHRALARSTHLATHDALTGLPNRALFRDRVEQSLAWSRREGTSLAVLYLDLDRFKEVNDTLGHAAGDRLLIGVAGRLRACVRETDTLARLGGDEFAILQIGARQLARHRDAGAAPDRCAGAGVRPGWQPGHRRRQHRHCGAQRDRLMLSNVDAGILLQEADVALYRAKEEGRATYRFFAAEMNQRLLERRALEADILEALRARAVQAALSAAVRPDRAADRRCGGADPLAPPAPGRDPAGRRSSRWPRRPALIARIGEWVLHEACRQAALWPDLGCMAVNVSPVQFRRPGFCRSGRARAGADPDSSRQRLEIEITEGVLLHETEETLATLRRLRGTGRDDRNGRFRHRLFQPRLSAEVPLRQDQDRPLVRQRAADRRAGSGDRACGAADEPCDGHSRECRGCRTRATRRALLHEEGCEEVQGFLFSRALPAAAVPRRCWHRARRRLPQREPAPA